jgi:hypothetical protein
MEVLKVKNRKELIGNRKEWNKLVVVLQKKKKNACKVSRTVRKC